MSDYVDAVKNLKSHINTLRVLVGVTLSALFISLFVTASAIQEPDKQRLSIPPELKFGTEVTTGEIHIWEVYNFAGVLYQKLNLWRNEGKEDYMQNIMSYRTLMTPRYVAAKYSDYKSRLGRGELNNRTRSIQPLGHYSAEGGCGTYSDKCVVKLGAGRWKVWIDVRIDEYQKGRKTDVPYQIKDVSLRIPLLVVAEDDDPQYNPWGLKIDREFLEEVEQIDLDQEYQNYQEHIEAQKKLKEDKQKAKAKEKVKASQEQKQGSQSGGVL
jgi:integrating conjugative element protein (TIGR03746 family)